MRILVVENHAALANEVVRKIERAGFEVDLVETIQHARTTIDDCVYSLALLDRRLPDGDGVSLIPFIRTKQPVTRIFLLTALDAVDDRIEGLEAGADDYLTKPFNLDELVARIRAHLRRSGGEPTPPIRLGEMTFDFEQRTASVRGRPIQFSRRELILLEALLRRANRVVSRSSLTSLLYGRGLEVQEHALTSLASRLRVRLAELEAGVEIRSARALGYIICEIVADEA